MVVGRHIEAVGVGTGFDADVVVDSIAAGEGSFAGAGRLSDAFGSHCGSLVGCRRSSLDLTFLVLVRMY